MGAMAERERDRRIEEDGSPRQMWCQNRSVAHHLHRWLHRVVRAVWGTQAPERFASLGLGLAQIAIHSSNLRPDGATILQICVCIALGWPKSVIHSPNLGARATERFAILGLD